MSEIDRWVIDYAFRVATQRKKEGKDTLFFLRVSEASLLDEGFEEWIARRFRTRKVPPESVVFQIPEVVAEKHLVAAKSLAALAASLGVSQEILAKAVAVSVIVKKTGIVALRRRICVVLKLPTHGLCVAGLLLIAAGIAQEIII